MWEFIIPKLLERRKGKIQNHHWVLCTVFISQICSELNLQNYFWYLLLTLKNFSRFAYIHVFKSFSVCEDSFALYKNFIEKNLAAYQKQYTILKRRVLYQISSMKLWSCISNIEQIKHYKIFYKDF